jgi:hypothetical protein
MCSRVFVLLRIEGCLECCTLFCVMCVIMCGVSYCILLYFTVLYCFVLSCNVAHCHRCAVSNKNNNNIYMHTSTQYASKLRVF